MFVSAASAVQIHGTTPSSMADTASRQGAPVSFMKQFDRYFGTLATAVTGINTAIQQLTATTTTQYN